MRLQKHMRPIEDLLREAKVEYRIEIGRRSHYKVYIGPRLVATVAATPSCPRSLKNTIAELRRALQASK